MMAESEGFEPPEPFGSTVFKTAAIDHSASSPLASVTSNECIPQVLDRRRSDTVKLSNWELPSKLTT